MLRLAGYFTHILSYLYQTNSLNSHLLSTENQSWWREFRPTYLCYMACWVVVINSQIVYCFVAGFLCLVWVHELTLIILLLKPLTKTFQPLILVFTDENGICFNDVRAIFLQIFEYIRTSRQTDIHFHFMKI